MVKGWVKVLPFYLFTLLPLFAACSEADDTVSEYVNWQERNEAYFEQQYETHSIKYASWTKPSSMSISDLPHGNCILVDVIESGYGTVSPYYTDSVLVHYEGRLIPSATYPQGSVFDRSFIPPFDYEVDVPAAFTLAGLVDGFSTALQHMHRGDHWRVIVPYQLGYRSEQKTGIPAYSTLIFEIHLVDFWHEKEGDRPDV